MRSTRLLLAFLIAGALLALAGRLLPSRQAGGEGGEAAGSVHPDSVGRLMQALEYLEGDYREAVGGPGGPDAEEHAEQKEFGERAARLLAGFPASGAKTLLSPRLERLRRMIDSLAPAPPVEGEIRAMLGILGAQAGLEIPDPQPDGLRGRALFAERCAACHGPAGHGDGPAGLALDPRPADLADGERMARKGPLPIYHVLRYGVEGTGMPAFRDLEERDLWALTHHVLSLGRQASAAAIP